MTAMLIRTDLRPFVALLAGLLLSEPLAAQSADSSLDAGPFVSVASSGVRRSTTAAVSDTVPRRRPRAIEYSDWYARRATIHRVASWATVPLFAAEVVTGSELFKNGPQAADWAQDSHGAIAGALGGLFAVNTVTGLWNLWDARHDADGRTRRTIHGLLMLTADAGFAYAGSLADRAENSASVRSQHRTVALSSTGVALVSYLIMLPPLRKE